MNRLQHETSPYLLQHAANPVDWYPWGPEALTEARKQDKPILVSIGYSTCHWCHVMEHESFENETVAAFMNQHFICIKVDREERPDVDQVYMEACQAVSGSGGWPLNAFLLPDTRPFFAGTYYPPTSRYNRPGWIDLLRHIHKIFTENRSKVETQAEQLTASIGKAGTLFVQPEATEADPLAPARIENMMATLKSRIDTSNGGFGGAPKFPMSQALELLLDYGHLQHDQAAIQLAEYSLQAMIKGGIYDQLGGGFSRYTVDGKWRVPHFEKMLYDNALILRLLGKVMQIEPQPIYRETITETVGWLLREMRSPSGSFYAALDADSEGVEGKFYTWTHAALASLLSATELTQVQNYFGSSKAGNWEEEATNIFYRASTVSAADQPQWEDIKARLFAHREDRIRPGRDEKIILQWNGLMISGLVAVYLGTGEQQYVDLASSAMQALESELLKDGQWYRNFKDGRLGQPAFLDDYAALIAAQIDLYTATYDFSWLRKAEELVAFVLPTFGGGPGGLYFLRPSAGSELPVATLDLYDNALPSGNGQLLDSLRRLGQLTGKTQYVDLAREKLLSVWPSVRKYPTSFAAWGRLALLLAKAPRELVITGPGSFASGAEIRQKYQPDLQIVCAETEQPDFPILKDRYLENELQFFFCENQICHLPVDSIAALKQLQPNL